MPFQNVLDKEMFAAQVPQFNPGYFYSNNADAIHVYVGSDRLPKRKVDEYLWIYGPPDKVCGVQIYQARSLVEKRHFEQATWLPATEDLDYSVLIQLVLFSYTMTHSQTIARNVGMDRWAFICLQVTGSR